ncbi:MAG: GNAT family N-acetyltransferase [Chthoniobacterales bacterium]
MPAHASESMQGAQWRPMTEHDLDAVAAIAAIGFPDHYEGRDIFANRLAVFPAGCFSLGGKNGHLLGYLIAYPWLRESAPVLNGRIEAIPPNADLIYLHDLALLPEVRGLGKARAIVEQLVISVRAEGWPALGLVAVNNAASFWMRQGFRMVETPALRAKLASYGAAACYMVREL